MKTTMKRSFIFILATFSSACLFAQVNLNLSSTVQAATNVTASTAAITKASSSLTKSTKSAISATSNRAASLKTKPVNSNEAINIQDESTATSAISVNGNGLVSGNVDANLIVNGEKITDDASAIAKETTSGVKSKTRTIVNKVNQAKDNTNANASVTTESKSNTSVSAEKH